MALSGDNIILTTNGSEKDGSAGDKEPVKDTYGDLINLKRRQLFQSFPGSIVLQEEPLNYRPEKYFEENGQVLKSVSRHSGDI